MQWRALKAEQVMSALAAAVASRIGPVLPDGFQASTKGTTVSLSTPTGKALRDVDIYSHSPVIDLEAIDLTILSG